MNLKVGNQVKVKSVHSYASNHFKDQIGTIVKINDNGSIRLDIEHFNIYYSQGFHAYELKKVEKEIWSEFTYCY